MADLSTTLPMKRKAWPKSATNSKPSKRRREETEESRHDAPESGHDNDKICATCSSIDFEELFKRKTKARDGFWGPNVGNPATDSTCPLCRFFAVMIPSLQPPPDEKSGLAYRDWQKRSKDNFLVAFSPCQVFGIHDQKPTSRLSKTLVGSLLTVLPGWLRNTAVTKTHIQFWENPQIDHGFILLEDSSSDPEGFSGRQVLPSVVDVDLILSWIRYCDEKHKKHCASTTDSTFKSLKVIDCETREIIHAPPARPYIALSYVWGTESSTSTPEEPSIVPETCSLVIEDAIQIVKRLNHRYL
jgi:hypothetical protein